MTDISDSNLADEQIRFEAVAAILAAGLGRIPKTVLKTLAEDSVTAGKISENGDSSTEIGLDLSVERSVDGVDG